jgi:hypothetical protein
MSGRSNPRLCVIGLRRYVCKKLWHAVRDRLVVLRAGLGRVHASSAISFLVPSVAFLGVVLDALVADLPARLLDVALYHVS